jgi:hypothetical protein
MIPLTKMKIYRRRRNIETSIFLASIDTFLQNPGIDSIEYLVSISIFSQVVSKTPSYSVMARAMTAVGKTNRLKWNFAPR